MTDDKPRPEDAEEESLKTVERDDCDETAIQDDIAADAKNADGNEPKQP